MSSAYSKLTINSLHSGLHDAATSSRYMANKKGESTETCRTLNSNVNSVDQGKGFPI